LSLSCDSEIEISLCITLTRELLDSETKAVDKTMTSILLALPHTFIEKKNDMKRKVDNIIGN
jgi:hypothetical protein